MASHTRRTRLSGFTLLELLVVMVIIGLLASDGQPGGSGEAADITRWQ